jgi:hypothetical protein
MEENVENVVEETTQPTEQTVDESKFKSAGDDNVIKVDLSKPPKPEEENETKEDNADDSGVAAESKDAEPTEKQEEVQPEAETQETPVLEEVTEETTKPVENIESVVEEQTGQAIPEGLQKVIDFMEETGGSLEDYVKLNQDYGNYDDMAILKEFYKQTKPHLTEDEINFLIEDNFIYNEEIEEERDVRKKKIALKEQVASAKAHLDGQKSKYYEEIKAGSKLTKEQQKAINFFNRYNKESEENNKIVEKQTNTFLNKTNEVFNDFKGFEYKVGDKRYRFNVKDVDKVKENQSDINNFVKKFLNENNEMSDAIGYHKSLFTAMNSDAIANHFYEQGKADALKETIAKSKNVNMDPRKVLTNENTSGPKVRILDDKTQPTFRVKKQI